MFFEPRPPPTREAEKQGVDCQHWLPYTHYAHGIPTGSHLPRHGPPSLAIVADLHPGAVESGVAATTAREDRLILGISPAFLAAAELGCYWSVSILYQEVLTPQGTSVGDEEGDEQ